MVGLLPDGRGETALTEMVGLRRVVEWQRVVVGPRGRVEDRGMSREEGGRGERRASG